MPVIDFNTKWMIYNCFLALLAVVFGYFAIRSKTTFTKGLFGLLWLLFLPNTIYIFTDLVHLIDQWHEVLLSIRGVLVLQYVIFELIGMVTFLLAFLPVEKVIKKNKSLRKRAVTAIVSFNFLIALGMVLGRVERNNSWDVFTQPAVVVRSTIHVLTSLELLGLTILFGLLCNFIYFLFRERIVRLTNRYSR
jgi:uncharacterized membrane protein